MRTSRISGRTEFRSLARGWRSVWRLPNPSSAIARTAMAARVLTLRASSSAVLPPTTTSATYSPRAWSDLSSSRPPRAPTIGIGRRGPINNWTREVGSGATVALDPCTGRRVWTFPQFDVSALDAKTGKELEGESRRLHCVAPITYRLDGKQYISAKSGHTLVTFAQRD